MVVCPYLYTPEPDKLQMSKEEAIGKNMMDILPADVRSTFRNVFKKDKKSKKLQLFVYRSDGKNEPMMFEGRTVPLNEHVYLNIVRDITERKEVEKTLFIRNRTLASAGNGISIVDARSPDCLIIFANIIFYKMTG